MQLRSLRNTLIPKTKSQLLIMEGELEGVMPLVQQSYPQAAPEVDALKALLHLIQQARGAVLAVEQFAHQEPNPQPGTKYWLFKDGDPVEVSAKEYSIVATDNVVDMTPTSMVE